jgi:hypothetical protein
MTPGMYISSQGKYTEGGWVLTEAAGVKTSLMRKHEHRDKNPGRE